MNCPRCSAPLVDNAVFCSQCGAIVAKAPILEAARPPSVRRIIKALAASPLFLVATIAATAAAILSLLSLKAQGGAALSLGVLPINADEALSAAIIAIPAILLITGLWLIYASARNRQKESVGSAGPVLLLIVSILSLIGAIIFSGVVVLVLFILWAFGGFGTAGVDYLTLATLVVVSILTLFILFFVKAITTVVALRRTLATDEPPRRVSLFFIGMLFLSGGCSALSTRESADIFALLTAICGAVALCCFALILCQYRKHIRILKSTPQDESVAKITSCTPEEPTEPVPEMPE